METQWTLPWVVARFLMAGMVLLVAFGGAAVFRMALTRDLSRGARLTDHWSASAPRLTRLLLVVPIIAWLVFFLVALVALLFVSAMSVVYTCALLHGEWFLLLHSLPRTAGNVVVHIVYPLQMVLFSLITFYLTIGGFQLVLGPVDALARFRLRMDDVSALASRLAALLALVAGLEVIKILSYSLLVVPERLGEFFARETTPKADPLGVSLLAAALVASVVAWRHRERNRP